MDGINMALKKAITLENGVTVSYHRVVSVFCMTNVENRIEVCSYIDEAGRENEKAFYVEDSGVEDVTAYMHTEFIQVEYDEQMGVVSAYEWLKEQPKFQGAEDV